MKKVGLIGFGAIGVSVAAEAVRSKHESFTLDAVWVRKHQEAAARQLLPNSTVTSRLSDFLAVDLDIVVEAAGHSVIIEHGAEILARGYSLYVLSVGALANSALLEKLLAAAESGGGRIVITAGALGGFDGLMALRHAGLTMVKYTTTKPAIAWRGTAADREYDLSGLQEPIVIFTGSAREAALKYPRNANLAAAVAIAGLGFDRTSVSLIADPRAVINSGRLEATASVAALDLTLNGTSFEGNPKSSEITAMSVIASLENGSGPIRFG